MDLTKSSSPLRIAILLVICLAAVATVLAQSSKNDQDIYGNRDIYKGFTAYEEFRGSTSNLGQLIIADTNLGYDFDRFAGVDIGIPVFFARGSLSAELATGRPNRWRERLGDPYVDLRFTAENRILNYATVLTGSVPVSRDREFSTGRVGAEWLNHFDKHLYAFTPFVNVSIANGVLNTRQLSQPFRLDRPFRTLGLLGNAEAGTDINIWHSLTVGGSAYQFAPAGHQQFFSGPNQSPTAQGVAANAQELNAFTHDRGYSAWVRFDPTRFLFTELGYDHSIRLRQNSASLTIGFNLKSLFQKPTIRH